MNTHRWTTREQRLIAQNSAPKPGPEPKPQNNEAKESLEPGKVKPKNVPEDLGKVSAKGQKEIEAIKKAINGLKERANLPGYGPVLGPDGQKKMQGSIDGIKKQKEKDDKQKGQNEKKETNMWDALAEMIEHFFEALDKILGQLGNTLDKSLKGSKEQQSINQQNTKVNAEINAQLDGGASLESLGKSLPEVTRLTEERTKNQNTLTKQQENLKKITTGEPQLKKDRAAAEKGLKEATTPETQKKFREQIDAIDKQLKSIPKLKAEIAKTQENIKKIDAALQSVQKKIQQMIEMRDTATENVRKRLKGIIANMPENMRKVGAETLAYMYGDFQIDVRIVNGQVQTVIIPAEGNNILRATLDVTNQFQTPRTYLTVTDINTLSNPAFRNTPRIQAVHKAIMDIMQKNDPERYKQFVANSPAVLKQLDQAARKFDKQEIQKVIAAQKKKKGGPPQPKSVVKGGPVPQKLDAKGDKKSPTQPPSVVKGEPPENKGAPEEKAIEQRLKTLMAGGTLEDMQKAGTELQKVLTGINDPAVRKTFLAMNQSNLTTGGILQPTPSGWTATVNTPNGSPSYTVQVQNSGQVTVTAN